MAHLPRTNNPIILFLSFLILCKLGASQTYIRHILGMCRVPRDAYNQTNNQIEDMFQVNLISLLTQFSSRSASLSFYKSAVGEPPDKAYGLYLCRGDTSSDLCHSCITQLTDWVNTTGCSLSWTITKQCMILYANSSSFGNGDNIPFGTDLSKGNATNAREFNRTVGDLVDELIPDAAFGSERLFATREASVGGVDGKVYGLAQCIPGIGGRNCSVCLKEAYAEIQRCCVGKTCAWVFFSNCQLMYRNSSSYDVVGSTPASSNPLAASPAWTLLLFMLNLIMLS